MSNSQELVRLSVNMNTETAAAPKRQAAIHGISYTEAIRRAIAVYAYMHDEKLAGRKFETMDRDGGHRREIVLL